MKTRFILYTSLTFFIFSSCKKIKIGNNACEDASITIGLHSDSSYVWAPTIFTPNGDGKNDIFYIRYKNIANFRCTIKSGVGKKLFDSGDYTKGWDGTNNGKEVKDGVYKVIVSVTINGQQNELEGDVCLLRNTDKYCPGNIFRCTFDNQFGDFGYDPNNPSGEMVCL